VAGGTRDGTAGSRGTGREDWPLEYETWDLTDTTTFYRYAKADSDHLVEVSHANERGFGIVEYMVLPGYARYADAIPPRPE
jgi:hypothetical protein